MDTRKERNKEMTGKTTMLAALFTMAGAVAVAVPSQDSYHAVTNDWYNGNFSNVLELASSRLAVNTNDLVGTYLKLSWDVCFADIPTLSNSVTRAIALSDAETNAAFSNDFQRLRPVMVAFRDQVLPNVTEEMRLAELPKASLPHKPIPEKRWLKLLWDNGIWTPVNQQ
jgi:hypothetical protein